MKVAWLILLILTGSAQQTARATGATPEQIRLAASRAVAIVERGATGFYKSQNCFSCHSLALPMMVFQAGGWSSSSRQQVTGEATLAYAVSESAVELRLFDKDDHVAEKRALHLVPGDVAVVTW